MPETFEQIQARFRAELTPADHAHEPCPLAPLIGVPHTGLQFLRWADSVQHGPKRRHYCAGAAGLVKSIAWEGRRRGWGTRIKAYTREQVAQLYPWAVAWVRREDDRAAAVEMEHGAIVLREPRRPR